MSKLITIFEILFVLCFIIWSLTTNNLIPDRIYFTLLEISMLSGYHLYEKFKGKIE